MLRHLCMQCRTSSKAGAGTQRPTELLIEQSKQPHGSCSPGLSARAVHETCTATIFPHSCRSTMSHQGTFGQPERGLHPTNPVTGGGLHPSPGVVHMNPISAGTSTMAPTARMTPTTGMGGGAGMSPGMGGMSHMGGAGAAPGTHPSNDDPEWLTNLLRKYS